MTKAPFSMKQDGGITGKDETSAFIVINGVKPAQHPDKNIKCWEGSPCAGKPKILLKTKNMFPVCGILLAVVILVWLLTLTVVREFQLTELRQNIEELRTELETLQTRLSDHVVVDELKGFQDEIDAESNDDFLDKLYNYPSIYDDDFDDDAIEASTDYKNDPEYDDKDIITRLDFLGEVMEAKLQDKSQVSTDERPKLKKIIRIFQDNNDGKAVRSRRHSMDELSETETERYTPRVRKRRPSGKQVLVAHFNGDTRDLQVGKHRHYHGNGKLRHPLDVPYTNWAAAPWLADLNMDKRFSMRNGAVRVPENGIYFVYAQVFYHDEHDENGFKLIKRRDYDDEAILFCYTMTHTNHTVVKHNTCYTAGVFLLKQGDDLSLKNSGSMRYSIMQPGKSFFGLFKLSDVPKINIDDSNNDF